MNKYIKIFIVILVIFIISLLVEVILTRVLGESGYRFIKFSENKPLTWSEISEERDSILRYTLILTVVGVFGYYNVKKYMSKK